MKLIYTKDEVSQVLLDAIGAKAPEGKVAKVTISEYGSDYCTVIFKEKESSDEVSTIDEKPLDLSEIPF